MKTKNDFKLVEVFDGSMLQAEMLRSLLENAEIEAIIKDGIMGTLNPWYTAPGGAGAVSVWVADTNLEKAKQIVSDYQNNISP
jgi:hypothetical protein